MYNDLELRDLDRAFGKTLVDVRARADHPTDAVDYLLGLDQQSFTEDAAEQLIASLPMYVDPAYLEGHAVTWIGPKGSRVPVIRPIRALVLSWAEDGEPLYVPHGIAAAGLVDATYIEDNRGNHLTFGPHNFYNCGGMELGSVICGLWDAVDADPDLVEREVYADLRRLYVLWTMAAVRDALPQVAASRAFATIPRGHPFAFYGVPGHDEPPICLHRVAA